MTMQGHTEYLQQVDVLHDSIINEQIKSSPLYEINLKQEYNSSGEERDNYYTGNHQPFTTNQYESQRVKFPIDLAEPSTSLNEEHSRWLSKQDDSPLLKTENNTVELLKKVNEVLETHDGTYIEKNEEKNAIQELFNKINEILKPEHGRIRNKTNKTRVDESNPYHKYSNSHDLGYTGRVHRSDENRALFNNNRRGMYENDDDIPRMPISEDSIHENELDSLIHRYTSFENIRDDMFYDSTYLNNESNTIANLEEQFTGASLEYWGDHSIGSIEHSLTQSEWNILKSSNESMNWLQHPFNQSNWLRSSFV